MNKHLITAILTLFTLTLSKVSAQEHRILSQDIASLEVMRGNDWMHLPVVKLYGNDPLNIGFDDMSHTYRRLRYDIQLLNFDFSENNDLFKNEYLIGVTDQLYINDYQESIGTSTLYTHYSLSLPNPDVKIKVPGNYLLSVYDDNADEVTPLLEVYFMVVDESMTTGISFTTNTDIDMNKNHQQVQLSLNYGQRQVIDPNRQLHTIIMQNNRWRTAVRDAVWDQRTPSSLKWQHQKKYIFNGHNEQHKFEYLDLHRNSLGVESTGFDGTNYHVYVTTDVPRKNYVYDQSGQGAFIIRNTDNYEEDYTTEYFLAHFSVSPNYPIGASGKPSGDNSTLWDEGKGASIFIDGLWTRGSLAPEYELTYNPESNLYETTVNLKMGYYSYQYLIRHADGTISEAPFEGDFFETQNTYQALIYYRPIGGRSDLLVGYATTNY